jgi:hypothetical protein
VEREVYQNHQDFMEKIKFRQEKYKDTQSELAEISQEMLFLSKIYNDNLSKIKKHTDMLRAKIENLFPTPEREAEKLYF